MIRKLKKSTFDLRSKRCILLICFLLILGYIYIPATRVLKANWSAATGSLSNTAHLNTKSDIAESRKRYLSGTDVTATHVFEEYQSGANGNRSDKADLDMKSGIVESRKQNRTENEVPASHVLHVKANLSEAAENRSQTGDLNMKSGTLGSRKQDRIMTDGNDTVQEEIYRADVAFISWNSTNLNTKEKRTTESKTSNRWVVIALAVSHDMKMDYAFCLPFAVAAWKRINWNVTVHVFGNITFWMSSPWRRLVHKVTLKTYDSVKFVAIRTEHNPVSYSQVGRLFASLVTPWIRSVDIIMTSDIDIMPLARTTYDKVNTSGIFILNTDCCGAFIWKEMKIKMNAMTAIGMTKSNWQKLMGFKNDLDHALLPFFINSWLGKQFQMSISLENVKKGGNEGWYMDQRVFSIQLHLHAGDIPVYRVTNPKISRLDRRDLDWGNLHLESLIDCHMYHPSFSGVKWDNTLKLVYTIFEPQTIKILQIFRDDFVKLI